MPLRLGVDTRMPAGAGRAEGDAGKVDRAEEREAIRINNSNNKHARTHQEEYKKERKESRWTGPGSGWRG